MKCRVKISALALLKMVMHARSGGRLEVCSYSASRTQQRVESAIQLMQISKASAIEGHGNDARENCGRYVHRGGFVCSAS